MIPETRLLRYFVAVAEELSFTRAAERLDVTQQVLSAQIRLLEDNLGVELFRRTTRRVELTPAGVVFLEDTRGVLSQIERAAERARLAARGEFGDLRICYTLTVAYEALPKILDELGIRAPDLRIATRELYASDIQPVVAEGVFDLGLEREPELFPGLEAQEIRRESWVVALAEHHPLAAEPEIPLGALAGETVVVWPREMAPVYYDAMLRAFERAEIRPEVDTRPAGAALHHHEIALGRRVTLAVSSLANQRPNGVALVPIAPPPPTVGLSVVWKSGESSPAVEHFLETANILSEAEAWLV